jgi:hypothetical protein
MSKVEDKKPEEKKDEVAKKELPYVPFMTATMTDW